MKKQWQRGNNNEEQQCVYSEFTTMDGGKGRRLICLLNPSHEDYEENAKLIAAAPDLLEVAQAIIENSNDRIIHLDYEGLTEEHYVMLEEEHYVMLKAAITKATT